MPEHSALEQFMLDTHKSTTDNRLQLQTDGGGMCGHCLKESKYETLRWYETIGVCPHCGVDCMVPLSVAHKMSRESKEAFHKYWFIV